MVEIIVDQKDLIRLHEAEVSEYRNQTVGFVFQAHHLLPSCTVLENVMLPGLAGFGAKANGELKDRANDLLEKLGSGIASLIFQDKFQVGRGNGGHCPLIDQSTFSTFGR